MSEVIMTEKIEKALKYMDEKYGKKFGDEFEIIDVEYAGFASRANTYIMSTKRFADFFVNVECLDGQYYDSYMEIHFYKQYQEYMQPIFEKIFGECKVFMKFDMLATKVYNEETTFEEYMKTTVSSKAAQIVVFDDSNMKEKLEQVAACLKELKLPHGEVMVYTAKDYKTVSQLDNLVEVRKYEKSQSEKIYNNRYYRLYMGRSFSKMEITERSLELR